MYLQIIHKTQSKDLRLGPGPNQSCQSVTRSYSTRPRTRAIDSCSLKASKVWYILHYSLEASYASFDRSKILYKPFELSFKAFAFFINQQNRLNSPAAILEGCFSPRYSYDRYPISIQIAL